ncbi:MAG: sodium/solute symporter [Clostridiales bacterium]|nr:sodium/solute symporter [Clostridiales bacterium]
MQFVVVGIYAVLIILISVISAKKSKTVGDFYLGGRNIGGWVAALGYGTTYFSAVMFVGYAGSMGAKFGISSMWIGIANGVLGTLFAWLVLAKPTSQMTRRIDASTMPSFFEKRYDSKGMKILATIIIFVFLVPYCASVYQGLSYVFESAFGIPYTYCMMAMAVLTLIYLLAGGYMASKLSDLLQAFIMVLGVSALVYFIFKHEATGGMMNGIEKLAAIEESRAMLFGAKENAFSLICLMLSTSLGTWGLPQMVHKFYAIKDEASIKRGTVVATVFVVLIGGIVYFLGGFGILFTGGAIPAEGSDIIMPTMMGTALPPFWLGIVVVLLMAASMGTLSSLVLASSSAITLDLIKGTVKKDLSEKKTLLVLRVLCAVFVVISFLIALKKPAAILTLMSLSWGAISGSFLAPFMLGVRWRGVTKAGAWAGMLGGILTTIGMALFWKLDSESSPVICVTSIFLSLVLTVVVSLVTKKFSKEHIEKMFG